MVTNNKMLKSHKFILRLHRNGYSLMEIQLRISNYCYEDFSIEEIEEIIGVN